MEDLSTVAATDLDPALHQPARLKIMILLANVPLGAFTEIARECKLTPGNLGAHLKALEEAGYLESLRGLVDRKPRVRYRVTPEGVVALRDYCRALRHLVQRIEVAVEDPSDPAGPHTETKPRPPT